MRLVPMALLAIATLHSQTRLDPASIPPELRQFHTHPTGTRLSCEVKPLRPALDFGFRFQTGYVLRVPVKEYSNSRHAWAVVFRVTPESSAAPVYFGVRYSLPKIPKNALKIEVGGGFVVGPGAYRVEWQLTDDAGRTCLAEWKIKAKLEHAERNVQLAIEPGMIRELTFALPVATNGETPDSPVTILLHAAPRWPLRTWLSGGDRVALLGLLSSLLERLPNRLVRVVVFSLDQQKEIYRSDRFLRPNLGEVARALDNLELGKVDLRVLGNPHGQADLFADLVNRELERPNPSGAVIILGPECRFFTKPSPTALAAVPEAPPRFYYLKYEPGTRLAHPELPDTIATVIHKLNGKTLVFRTPGDFAKVIGQVQQRAETK
jgi:hypothetical protein